MTTVAAAAATLVAGLLAAGAGASEERNEVLDALPPSAWPASISRLDPGLSRLDDQLKELDRRVVPLDQRLVEGRETVVVLASDILFAFDEARVPASFPTRVEELLVDVPQGADLAVHGHTDSLGDESYNQDLSQRRAEAVADVVATVRPDLRLEVLGLGESRPVAPNETAGQDDPEGRALNRRVELRYDG